MKSKVILVNGFPATGKSTLAKRLSEDLHLPLLGKDHLKEFLADTMKVQSDSWSAILGRAANAMLADLLQATAGVEPLILESAFIHRFAHDELQRALTVASAEAIEVYCTTERSERLYRSDQRLATGQRHVIHRDIQTIHDMTEAELYAKYEPLHVGQYVEVDTTHFGDAEYAELLGKIRAFMREGTNGESN